MTKFFCRLFLVLSFKGDEFDRQQTSQKLQKKITKCVIKQLFSLIKKGTYAKRMRHGSRVE